MQPTQVLPGIKPAIWADSRPPFRTINAPEPTFNFFSTEDGKFLRLHRYRGTKGPIIMFSGMATGCASFDWDAPEMSMVEFLSNSDYDLFCIEDRRSIDLPYADKPYTLDEVAKFDWPAAVDAVLQLSGAEAVHVVAHCVGSITFFMSVLGGHISPEKIKSACVTGVAAHMKVPFTRALKSKINLARAFDWMGIDKVDMSQREQRSVIGTLGDIGAFINNIVLAECPLNQICTKPCCARLCFVWGHLWQHENLNKHVHDNAFEYFGPVNLPVMKHLIKLVNAGHLVDASGKEVYMQHVERLRFPITLIHGSASRVFLPESTQETFDWLKSSNGNILKTPILEDSSPAGPEDLPPADGSRSDEGKDKEGEAGGLYKRYVVPNFGHYDLLVGTPSPEMVFPLIKQHLDDNTTVLGGDMDKEKEKNKRVTAVAIAS